MSVEESTFHAAADAVLQALAQAIDDALGDRLDVDVQGGILTVEFDDGRQFVVNKHAPNREIWLSSPLSGAWHFACDPAGTWPATRDPAVRLRRLLASELHTLTGTAVVLDD